MRLHGTVFALFLLLAVAVTWPLAIHLPEAVADHGDPLLNAWIIDWVCHALVHDPLHLYDAPIYHTGLYPLAYSENMTGIALLVLPFHLAGLSAVTVYNIALILGFAFSGYAAFVLAQLVVTRSLPASLVAGIFFAFTSFQLAHIQHIQIVWSGWLPLLLAALLLFWRSPGRKQSLLLGAAFAMNGLTNIHWLLFGGVATAATIGLLAVREPRPERAFWIRLSVVFVLAGLVLLPFLLPYQAVASEYGSRRTSFEARLGSASWSDWLVPSSRNRIYGGFVGDGVRREERELFPGVLVLFLTASLWLTRPRNQPLMRAEPTGPPRWLDAAIAASMTLTYYSTISDRVSIGRFSASGADVPAMLTVILLIVRFAPQLRARINNSRFTTAELSGALWLGLGVLGSLGWNAFVHPFLFRLITPFRATRTPARWAVIACVGLALLAAAGAADLLQRRGARMRRVVAALLLLGALAEAAPRIRWAPIDPAVPAVYRWLAVARPGVVLELPMMNDGAPFRYVLASTNHRVPIINGTSGWETPLHKLLRKKEEALQWDDQFLEAIRSAGCRVVIVHEDRLWEQQRPALAPMLARLKPLKRFGHDAVYALP